VPVVTRTCVADIGVNPDGIRCLIKPLRGNADLQCFCFYIYIQIGEYLIPVVINDLRPVDMTEFPCFVILLADCMICFFPIDYVTTVFLRPPLIKFLGELFQCFPLALFAPL